jgi:hypothetical protein
VKRVGLKVLGALLYGLGASLTYSVYEFLGLSNPTLTLVIAIAAFYGASQFDRDYLRSKK